jgi:hypothetical protein
MINWRVLEGTDSGRYFRGGSDRNQRILCEERRSPGSIAWVEINIKDAYFIVGIPDG